jgi:hypothetical protein
MLVLRCTRKLLARLKQSEPFPTVESTTRLGDYAFMSQHVDARREATPSPDDLMRFLAQTPILPLKGASPIALTRARFGRPTPSPR